jgi:hypothetical protein
VDFAVIQPTRTWNRLLQPSGSGARKMTLAIAVSGGRLRSACVHGRAQDDHLRRRIMTIRTLLLLAIEAMLVAVTVKAGSFSGCVQTRDRSAIEELDERKTYCPGVSLVSTEDDDKRVELVELSGVP